MRSATCSRAGRARTKTWRRSRWARISTPSRPAANSTARSACSARSKPCARLHEVGYETNAPIEIVNWTNEEGSRYAPAMLASGVFAGVFTPEYAYSRTDRDGKTFGDELQRIGYRGKEKAGGAQIRRHVRAAYRTRADPRGRRPHDRRRPGRAGHALVRSHRHRPGGAYRRDADAAAQECAPRRSAHDRADQRHRARARARRGRRRRPDREQAEQPQRRSRRGFLHRSISAIPRRKCSTRWRRNSAPRLPQSSSR